LAEGLAKPRSKGQRQNFYLKNLENGDRYEVALENHLYVGPTGFRLAPSDLTLDDLEGSKIRVILFDVKCVKNGKSYGV